MAGALLFGYGARTDVPSFRWAGIALIASALALRWRRPPSTPDDPAG